MTRDPDCIPPVPTEEGGELKPSGWPDTRGPNWECPSCAESVCDHEPNCPHQIAVAAALQEEAGETLLSPAHQDTHRLLNRFSLALADKLARAEIKYGYGNGWLTDDWEAECRAQLHQHADKGDPLDVAAYAAFCWARGWSTSLPTQAPQDVAGLVEAVARVREEITVARLHGRDRPYIAIRTLDAEAILSALRASPIGHETSTSAENARVAQPHLVLAAADNNHETAVPDFLKRQTGELPPVTFPTWRDDGREGSREGAEEDPDNNHKALVEALRFYAVSGEDGEVARQALASLTTKETDRG